MILPAGRNSLGSAPTPAGGSFLTPSGLKADLQEASSSEDVGVVGLFLVSLFEFGLGPGLGVASSIIICLDQSSFAKL